MNAARDIREGGRTRPALPPTATLAVYLCFCLLATAAGFWPGAIVPPRDGGPAAAPLPAMQTLAVGQTIFFLLLYPILAAHRQSRRHPTATEGRNPFYLASLGEIALLFTVTAPFYLAAAWLSDATARDVVRTALTVLAFCPLGAAAGRRLARPNPSPWTLAAMAVLVLGLGGAWYIVVDFLGLSGDALRQVSPVLFASSAAREHQATLLPQPMQVWLVWWALPVAMELLPALIDRKSPRPPSTREHHGARA